ncbi:MAG TPA: choice-of-anchor Q domain-containing protein [Edaphobacter sp.]|nr:choice-of-anchor Q domain-containing protein [Edaphobacter sp.]
MMNRSWSVGVFCLLLLVPPFVFGYSRNETRHAQVKAEASAGVKTWYVRADGGDRKQCTGTADAAYRGHGSHQPCAFKHPYYLFTTGEYNNKGWVVQGGDTIIIRGGPYRMGYKGPEAKDMWGSCPGDPYGCSMPPLPSGTSDHPTRLLGENYQSCNKKTQLFGGYALSTIVNLSGSKNIDVECLELTDHSQCTRMGAGHPASEGCHGDFPLSDYAGSGISTNADTSDIVLKNLDIHGLTSRGIIGAIGGNVTVDHVRIAFNGGAGWDFDDGRGTESTPNASVHATYLTVEWNGCNEEYPITHRIPAFSCFDQNSGGYGDGVGTPGTSLNFSCDHCTFRYNTQDGLDLLHVRGSLISITNSISYGNMGQQWKMGAMRKVLFENNVTVHNCRRMSAAMAGAPEGYHRYLSLFCRAAGDGFGMLVNDDGNYTLRNNSFAGYGATTYDITCSGHCSKANIIFQNNLHIGYKDPVGGQLPGIFYMSGLPKNPFAARDHNIYYRMRTCPSGFSEHCINPKIVNMPEWTGEASLDALNFHLTSGSPARGAGVSVQGLKNDFDGKGRPVNGAEDIGAYQYQP